MEAARNAQFNAPESRRRGEMLRDYEYAGRPAENDHGMVKRFLDVVFPRTRDKQAVLGAYARSAWQL
jgi:hypothetical protein